MKARTLCVWYPTWSLGRPDVRSSESVLVVDERVTAASDDVLAAGVTLGMPHREAEALAPFARVLTRDLGEETRRFESVVTTVEKLVPRVEVVAPGLLYVPVAGAVKYYGGEESLAAEINTRLVGDPWPLIGVAHGPFAARWAAATARAGQPLIVEDTASFLSDLDLVSLRESLGGTEMIDTFRWLGISTLGEVARLPRDTVASRFGNQGVLAHRLASGEDRPVDPRAIPPEMSVSMEFEDPLEAIDAVMFAGQTLAERLIANLRAEGVSPHAVEIVAHAHGGPPRSRVWRSADPFTEIALIDRVRWQLSAWVDTAGVPGGVTGLLIGPGDLSGEGRQMGLLSDESTSIETERALVRAQALLGPDGVLQASPQGGRLPGERVSWSRWQEEPVAVSRDPSPPWPGDTPGPAPALVHSQSTPVDIEWDEGLPSRVRLGTRWEPVLTWSGPWRLTGRWWVGEGDVDRYQLVTSAGAFLCVVSDSGSYLAGVYD